MRLSQSPPTVAELVARALTATPFLAETAGSSLHELRSDSELCAQLAAENWEREHDAIVGAVVSSDLTAEVADKLEEHGRERRAANDNTAIYTAHAKLERTLAAVKAARCSLKGVLPIAAAEAMLDEVETHFAHIRIALTRAVGILGKEIEAIERLREAV